jgi:hypothetical protein
VQRRFLLALLVLVPLRCVAPAIHASDAPLTITCSADIAQSNASLNRLIASVEKGSLADAHCLAKSLKSLDGGNLEDALIALGRFSRGHMADFLALEKDGVMSAKGLSDALVMLPLPLSDDPSAQLSEMKARRAEVAKVGRPGLSAQKALALHAIDAFMDEIRSRPPEVR